MNFANNEFSNHLKYMIYDERSMTVPITGERVTMTLMTHGMASIGVWSKALPYDSFQGGLKSWDILERRGERYTIHSRS